MDNIQARHRKQLAVMRGWLEGRGYFTAAEALQLVSQLEVGFRKDGKTPKLHHQLSVTRLLVTLVPHMQHPEETLTAAILHDVIEDHGAEYDQDKLGGLFGPLVGKAVWTLSKKTVGITKDPEKYYQDIAACPISSLVKPGDRAHNIVTMPGVFTPEKMRSYLDDLTHHFYPMIRTARRNFPRQYPAYENLKIILRSQQHLITHFLDKEPP